MPDEGIDGLVELSQDGRVSKHHKECLSLGFVLHSCDISRVPQPPTLTTNSQEVGMSGADELLHQCSGRSS